MKKFSFLGIVILFSLIGVILALVFVNYIPKKNTGIRQGTVSSVSPVVQAVQSPAPVKVVRLQVAEPQTLVIPKLNITAAVESVGEDSSGKMAVPEKVEDVGWYNLGYKPGEKGSAVMAGHLDDVTGAPAVFYYLGQLQAGDEVIVTDKNGKTYTFEVTDVQSYAFDSVPLQQVFASNDKPRLNLITCTGIWNQGSRNYSNRLVVYTELRK